MPSVLLEIYVERGGSRAPIFSTSDRHLAWEVATAVDKALSLGRSSGEVVMLAVDGDCILNDKPDWRHPDFPRERAKMPLVAPTGSV